jgi:hypothetical protein
MKDTVDTLFTAAIGVGSVGVAGVAADAMPTAEDIQTIGQIIIQTIIGIITIYQLLKRKKK